MRDYLFRGKRKDNGEWITGFYVHYDDTKDNHKDDCDYIVGIHTGEHFPFFEVIPSTVGQYTGLTDKNGKKIFEGDILEDFIGQKCAVTYESGYYYPLIAFPEFRCWSTSECAVISNIHDNPELLKGGD